MRTVHKYPFPLAESFPLDLPEGSWLLHVDVQEQQPCMWWEVESLPVLTQRRWFAVVGTGHPLPDQPVIHLGTFQMPPYVWHLYEQAEGR